MLYRYCACNAVCSEYAALCSLCCCDLSEIDKSIFDGFVHSYILDLHAWRTINAMHHQKCTSVKQNYVHASLNHQSLAKSLCMYT